MCRRGLILPAHWGFALRSKLQGGADHRTQPGQGLHPSLLSYVYFYSGRGPGVEEAFSISFGSPVGD